MCTVGILFNLRSVSVLKFAECVELKITGPVYLTVCMVNVLLDVYAFAMS